MGGGGGGPGGPKSSLSGGGAGGPGGAGKAGASKAGAPIDMVYLQLKAKNLNRTRELANREFADMVQKILKTNSMFVAGETKLIGDIQNVVASDLTFGFQMQLKLKEPIIQQDLQGALPANRYTPASGGGMGGAMGGMGGSIK